MRHTNLPSKHDDLTDDETQRLKPIATIAGAGAIAQACVFPEFGIAFGFLTGMLLCIPGLVTEFRTWRNGRATKLGIAIFGLALLTLFMAAVSHALFKFVPLILES